ncbi:MULTISPECIES: hypothetical protein [unclassified Deinococcus]|uniref:hypothetical protein n=1 Tax=unclassified Deinococcus TaxID=2623546 RepID=UPI001C306CCE|nr:MULTISPECIES: hypothetical protein [unclassified Deinococcus]MDK2014654.1 hypothetical protein [Deinococcus sp. 43]
MVEPAVWLSSGPRADIGRHREEHGHNDDHHTAQEDNEDRFDGGRQAFDLGLQPGLSRAEATAAQLDLLAATEMYLTETYQIPLRVIGSV